MSTEDKVGSEQLAVGRKGPEPLPTAHCLLPTNRKRRYASAAFVALLVLSVFWPSPIVSWNRLTQNRELAIDELSFLGREAPSWDVVFWCLAGLLLIAILQSADGNDFREPWRQLRAMRFAAARRVWIVLAIGAALVAIVWFFADAAMLAWAERVQSDGLENVIRIANRFGGGMNPALIVIFFLVAGVAYRMSRWTGYAVAMAVAGLFAGILGQIVKLMIGRARPELWLGPFQHAPGSSTSFPSGHTVGAFALAGVLVFASRNLPLRVIAFLLAAAVGLSRVFAFRHWLSDVTASAVIGLAAAYVAVTALTNEPREHP
ncbi:MAG TPA: phosphatase PAP2 family protein [Thermoanaerobaculia bacterium]|nr:phosphatase PAP2 family protein [Thermoanaerobaculia bacterium]